MNIALQNIEAHPVTAWEDHCNGRFTLRFGGASYGVQQTDNGLFFAVIPGRPFTKPGSIADTIRACREDLVDMLERWENRPEDEVEHDEVRPFRLTERWSTTGNLRP